MRWRGPRGPARARHQHEGRSPGLRASRGFLRMVPVSDGGLFLSLPRVARKSFPRPISRLFTVHIISTDRDAFSANWKWLSTDQLTAFPQIAVGACQEQYEHGFQDHLCAGRTEVTFASGSWLRPSLSSARERIARKGHDASGLGRLRRYMKPLAGRREQYRKELRALRDVDWVPYLREHSGLPGPRANLELAFAVAEEASPKRLDKLLAADEEYLVLCAHHRPRTADCRGRGGCRRAPARLCQGPALAGPGGRCHGPAAPG